MCMCMLYICQCVCVSCMYVYIYIYIDIDIYIHLLQTVYMSRYRYIFIWCMCLCMCVYAHVHTTSYNYIHMCVCVTASCGYAYDTSCSPCINSFLGYVWLFNHLRIAVWRVVPHLIQTRLEIISLTYHLLTVSGASPSPGAPSNAGIIHWPRNLQRPWISLKLGVS